MNGGNGRCDFGRAVVVFSQGETMMTKLLLIAGVAVLAVSASQAQAHDVGYGGYAGYADEGSDCGRDKFTILGAHAGATVLGFNAGVGGHFGFGDGCGHHHHAHAAPAQAYTPPPEPPQVDPYPAAYPQAPWGAPYAYRTYGRPQTYAPPPPSYAPPRPGAYDPCDVCARPPGW